MMDKDQNSNNTVFIVYSSVIIFYMCVW